MRVDGEPLHALIGAQAHRPDYDAARAELALARKALGAERLPPLVLLGWNDPTLTRIDEHLQSRWSEVLGLEVRVVRQSFKQGLAQAREGRFDVRMTGFTGNLWKPVSYAEPFTTGANFHGGAYESQTYDACVERARRGTERAERIAAYRCIHEHWIEDRPGLPVAEGAESYLVHPRLTGLVRSAYLHDPDLTHARILPPAEEE
jgi:ABC-type oligopeptide transport system substrate-binding subunit